MSGDQTRRREAISNLVVSTVLESEEIRDHGHSGVRIAHRALVQGVKNSLGSPDPASGLHNGQTKGFTSSCWWAAWLRSHCANLVLSS